MTGRDIFKIWAPVGARWVDWVRPVPFVAIDSEDFKIYKVIDFKIPKINYIDKVQEDTAIILDLPGYSSVLEGIALGNLGFRPIPIYNGTNEQKGAISIVDNHAVESVLIWGALEIKKIEIGNEAPPVFLLDSNRMLRIKMNSTMFDNSWDIYAQDIPTAQYFLKNGINKIIVRGENIQKDLNKILYQFQKEGIKILFTNGYEEPKIVNIKKSRYKN